MMTTWSNIWVLLLIVCYTINITDGVAVVQQFDATTELPLNLRQRRVAGSQSPLLYNQLLSSVRTQSNANSAIENTGEILLYQQSLEKRVVGGSSVDVGNYPFFVQWGSALCGGTLIHDDMILSAAHCFSNYTKSRNNTVWIGSVFSRGQGDEKFQVQIRTIVDFFMHPKFDLMTNAYDFLVMRLNAPVNGIQPVSLNGDPSIPADSTKLKVIGFGALAEGSSEGSKRLQEAKLYATPHEICAKQYALVEASVEKLGKVMDDIMICASGHRRDSCQGDSGGPLLDEVGQQVGLVSWGFGCGRPYFSGVYARISTGYNWIRQQVCVHSKHPFSSSLCRQVTVEITTDKYPSENSFVLLDSNGFVVHSLSNLENVVEPRGTLVLDWILPQDSYTFVSYDKYSDGFCCNHGDGEIRISIDSDLVTAKPAAFSYELKIQFNVESKHKAQLENTKSENYKIVDPGISSMITPTESATAKTKQPQQQEIPFLSDKITNTTSKQSESSNNLPTYDRVDVDGTQPESKDARYSNNTKGTEKIEEATKENSSNAPNESIIIRIEDTVESHIYIAAGVLAALATMCTFLCIFAFLDCCTSPTKNNPNQSSSRQIISTPRGKVTPAHNKEQESGTFYYPNNDDDDDDEVATFAIS